MLHEISNVEETEFAIDELLNGYLVGGVHDTGHITPAADSFVGKQRTAESVGIRLEEGKLRVVCKGKTGEKTLNPLRKTEGVLNRTV